MYHKCHIQSVSAHVLFCGIAFHRAVTFHAIEISHHEKLTVKLDGGYRGNMTDSLLAI